MTRIVAAAATILAAVLGFGAEQAVLPEEQQPECPSRDDRWWWPPVCPA